MGRRPRRRGRGRRLGVAYAGWRSDSNPSGYGQFLRGFSITRGWLSAAFRVSGQYASASVWPGDTFGISTLSSTNVLLSWGGRVNGKQFEIFAASVAASLP